MYSTTISIGLMTLVLSSCTPSYQLDAKDGAVGESGGASDDGSEGDAEDGTAEDDETFADYDGAMLEILAPESGDFIPLGEEADFEAIVFGTDGHALPFDDIVWQSNIDLTWTKVGSDFEDDSLDVGSHALTAVAELPNGDRLAYTVGGVLVQHEHAGTYVGEMSVSVNVEYEGIPIGTTCIGAATIVVDIYGETALGESTCHIDLMGFLEFDLRHTFEYDIDEDDIDGSAVIALDIVGFDLPFESLGEIDDGEIGAGWGGSLMGFADFEGDLQVTRITRSVELVD